MRFLRIVAKNFKLLSRSKSSAFILFAGPILIILLVGLFFSGKGTSDLSVGYYAVEKNGLTSSFVEALHNKSFVVYEYPSEDSCVEKIKQGVIHTCIIFPKGFAVRNGASSELRFIVDYSRLNLVYKVIDSVSGMISGESKELSYSLTSVLLFRINSTAHDLSSFESDTSKIISEENAVGSDVAAVGSGLSSMQLDVGTIKVDSFRGQLNRTNVSVAEFYSKADEISAYSYKLLGELSGLIDENASGTFKAAVDVLNNSLSASRNSSKSEFNDLFFDFSHFEDAVADFAKSMERNNAVREDLKGKIVVLQGKVTGVTSDLKLLSSGIRSSREQLESIGINNAGTIVSPVNTKIEPLISESSNFQFSFPFLMVLLLMFVSLMIASTLVIFEKTSRAVFRNFMVPVSQNEFVLSHFVTVVLIVLVQAIIILLISGFSSGIGKIGLSSLLPLLLILFSAAVFFTSIGMLIGLLFSSQEGAVMASLITGSVFFFISNLVVPLESLAPGFSGIIRFNPFILFSDLLRRTLLFGAPISDSILTLGILLWIGFSLLAIIFIAKGTRRSKKNSQVLKR